MRMVSAESRIASVVSLKKAGAVDHDELVREAQRLDHPLDTGRRDELGHLGAGRREQHADAGRMVDHQRVDRLDLVAGLFELRDEVGDRLVLRIEVQEDPDIAELERAIDEDDLLAELGGRGDGQVDRQRRAADAALGAEHGDDLAGVASRRRARAARAVTRLGGDHRHPRHLLALAGEDLADRRGQLVAAERLDQELARAGQHRAAEVVRLALDRHHDHGGGRDGSRQLLGRRDAVHVRHVDVHQDDVRLERHRELQGLDAGRGCTHHVDVTLEAEQLREVVARLRDVVDDQDTDLFGHLRVWLFVLDLYR